MCVYVGCDYVNDREKWRWPTPNSWDKGKEELMIIYINKYWDLHN